MLASGRAPQSVMIADDARCRAIAAPRASSSTPNAIAGAAHAVSAGLTVPSWSSAKAYCSASGIQKRASSVASARDRMARASAARRESPIAAAIRANRSRAATQTPLRYTSDRIPICRSPTSSAPAPASGFSIRPSPSPSVERDQS